MPSTGDFPDALDPVFRAMMEEPFDGEEQSLVSQFFDMETSDRPEERLTSISGLPKPPNFMGTLAYRSPDQGFDVTATHIEVAMGTQITRRLWDDDQHGKIKRIFSGFRNAFHERKQDEAADFFNGAFTTTSAFYNHSEGVSVCNNSHLTPSSGVSTASGFDNLSTAGLSATALTADRYTFRLFKNFKGFSIDKVPDTIFVPAELDDEALKITRTRVGLDTAAGDVNVQAGRYRVLSSTRLSDANNWFVMNMRLLKESLIWYTRKAFESDRMESFDQFNFKGRGYERYSHLWLFWQGLLGHEVA